jgi:hypothetical protein
MGLLHLPSSVASERGAAPSDAACLVKAVCLRAQTSAEPPSAARAALSSLRGPRPLFVSWRFASPGLYPAKYDLLVAESRNQLQLSAQSLHVPLKGRDLTIAKVFAALKARYVGLVHLRLGRNIKLRLSYCIA